MYTYIIHLHYTLTLYTYTTGSYIGTTRSILDQHIAGILPTSLPQLPIHLGNLRHNKKSLNTYSIVPLYSLYIPSYSLETDYTVS